MSDFKFEPEKAVKPISIDFDLDSLVYPTAKEWQAQLDEEWALDLEAMNNPEGADEFRKWAKAQRDAQTW